MTEKKKDSKNIRRLVTINKELGNYFSNFKIPKTNQSRFYLAIFLVFLIAFFAFLFKGVFVAAIVDGKPVFRFSILNKLENRYGSTLLDEEINRIIVFNELENKNIKIENAEIDSEIDQIRNMISSQGMTLEDALKSEKLTFENLRENIKLKIAIEKVLSDKIAVSDEEVQASYDENKEFYSEDQSEEEIKNQIKSSISQQKLAQEYQIWITQKKADVGIRYFVDY